MILVAVKVNWGVAVKGPWKARMHDAALAATKKAVFSLHAALSTQLKEGSRKV